MMNVSFLKLEIFIPETHLGALKAVLREVDAGHIGNYDCCLSYSQVMSTWRPLAGTDPYIGKENVISIEPELKVEVTIRTEKLRETMEAIKRVQMPKRHIFNKNSTLVVKRLKYLFWSHTVLSISKLRDVAKAVKSLEIPAFPKLIFQDWFCVISFLDAQDKE